MTDRLQGLVLTPEGLKPGYLAGPVGGGEKGRGGGSVHNTVMVRRANNGPVWSILQNRAGLDHGCRILPT